MPSLAEMVGKTVVAHVPFFHRTKLQELKLHAVEHAGIWVESQTMIDTFLSSVGASAAPKTLIFFLPFHQISYIWGVIDVPSLSETKLGVT